MELGGTRWSHILLIPQKRGSLAKFGLFSAICVIMLHRTRVTLDTIKLTGSRKWNLKWRQFESSPLRGEF